MEKSYILRKGTFKGTEWIQYDLNHHDIFMATELETFDGIIDRAGNFIAFINAKLLYGHDSVRLAMHMNNLDFVDTIQSSLRISCYKNSLIIDRHFYEKESGIKYNEYGLKYKKLSTIQIKALFNFLHLRGFKYADEMTQTDQIEKHILYGFFKNYYGNFFRVKDRIYFDKSLNGPYKLENEFNAFLSKYINNAYNEYTSTFVEIFDKMPPSKIGLRHFLATVSALKDDSIITPQNFKKLYTEHITETYNTLIKERFAEKQKKLNTIIQFYKKSTELLHPKYTQTVQEDLNEFLKYANLNNNSADKVADTLNAMNTSYYYGLLNNNNESIDYALKRKTILKNAKTIEEKVNIIDKWSEESLREHNERLAQAFEEERLLEEQLLKQQPCEKQENNKEIIINEDFPF